MFCTGPGSATAQLSPHWGNILGVFDQLLATLQRNNVPQFLVKKLFLQLFSFVNVQLFNQLLLRRECCSFSNGEYVKTGLAEVENWIHAAGKEWVGESWDELRYIRQVRGSILRQCTSNLSPPFFCRFFSLWDLGVVGQDIPQAGWFVHLVWTGPSVAFKLY